MQMPEWANLRPAAGWQVLELNVKGMRVYAYKKPGPLGGLLYVPGYLPGNGQNLGAFVNELRKQTGNLVCKLEPMAESSDELIEILEQSGWRPARSVQYEHTVRLDLAQSDQELWMSVKARCRQEVNYARRDGIQIEFVEPKDNQLSKMYDLLKQTSNRKDFGIRERLSMMNFWRAFAETGRLTLAWATLDKQIIAGAVFIDNGVDKAWYKDAGSKPEFAKHFGPRLLLWEAALRFQKRGLKALDLSGIPDPHNYESSHMKGIYIFKTAFAREVTTMMPAYELPLKPLLYPVWNILEPVALKSRRALSTLAGNLRKSRG